LQHTWRKMLGRTLPGESNNRSVGWPQESVPSGQRDGDEIRYEQPDWVCRTGLGGIPTTLQWWDRRCKWRNNIIIRSLTEKSKK
jgi:hypothetical protein